MFPSCWLFLYGLMATRFGHNNHYQAMSQKLKKKLVHIVQNRQFIWDPMYIYIYIFINPLNAELNSICHLLTLLGAHPIFHISRIRVNSFIIINSLKMCYLQYDVSKSC
jgi:hypothetical protein